MLRPGPHTPARRVKRCCATDGMQIHDLIDSEFRGSLRGGDALNPHARVDGDDRCQDDMLRHRMMSWPSISMQRDAARSRAGRARRGMPQEFKIRGGRLKHVLKERVGLPAERHHREQEARVRPRPRGAWLSRRDKHLCAFSVGVSGERRGLLTLSAVRELIVARDDRIVGKDRRSPCSIGGVVAMYLDRRAPDM